MKNSKVLLILVFVFTGFLGVGAVFLGWQLSKEELPDTGTEPEGHIGACDTSDDSTDWLCGGDPGCCSLDYNGYCNPATAPLCGVSLNWKDVDCPPGEMAVCLGGVQCQVPVTDGTGDCVQPCEIICPDTHPEEFDPINEECTGGVKVEGSCEGCGNPFFGCCRSVDVPTLVCDSLSASPTSLTKDQISGGTNTITLTAESTVSGGATVDTNGYDYDTDVDGATFSQDPNGDSVTMTIPTNITVGTYNAWVMVSGNDGAIESGCDSDSSCTPNADACSVQFTIMEADTLLCNTLTGSPSSISIDDIKNGDNEIELTTTTSTTGNSTIDNNGYDYGTDASGATFNEDPNGDSVTLTIPEGITVGTYNAWVMVSGNSGSRQSGCNGVASCTTGADNCKVQYRVTGGSCNCSSLSRSPAIDEIDAGEEVTYTMQVEDNNGNECEVSRDDVTWITTGTPELIEQEDTYIPDQGSASEHLLTYTIPSDSEDTTYCVSTDVLDQGVEDSCQTCFSTPEEEPEILPDDDEEEPDYVINKEGAAVCIEDNTAGELTYAITVTNISSVDGKIEYIEDDYDSKIESSWISSISPTEDSNTGGTLRWDNDGDGYELDAGETMTLSYEVRVPSTSFGDFTNVVVVKPENQDELEDTETVTVSCQVPEVGVSTYALTASLGALLMITLGLLTLRFKPQLLGLAEGGVGTILDEWKRSKKEKFEKRVIEELERDK